MICVIASSLPVSMSVSVSVTFLHDCPIFAKKNKKNNNKIKINNKITYIDCDVLHYMASLKKLYSMTLTSILKSKLLNINFSKTVRINAKMQDTAFVDANIPSNDTIVNIYEISSRPLPKYDTPRKLC